jgi:serine/threonine protein kinase
VVPVFHAGEESGRLYVTMRFVDGTDLRALLHEEGPLEAPRAVELIRQVADALDEAHAYGLVHRDVKPANILISTRRGSEHAFLTDFGVSKHRQGDPQLTGTGLAIARAPTRGPAPGGGRMSRTSATVSSHAITESSSECPRCLSRRVRTPASGRWRCVLAVGLDHWRGVIEVCRRLRRRAASSASKTRPLNLTLCPPAPSGIQYKFTQQIDDRVMPRANESESPQ